MSDDRPFSRTKSTVDRERLKFTGDYNDNVVVRIFDSTKDGWARVDVIQDSSSQETFNFKDSENTIIFSLTVTYTDNTRQNLLSVARS